MKKHTQELIRIIGQSCDYTETESPQVAYFLKDPLQVWMNNVHNQLFLCNCDTRKINTECRYGQDDLLHGPTLHDDRQ